MNEEWNGNNQNMNGEDYAFQTVMRNGRPKTKGWSVASLVLGILSVVCCCIGYAGIVFGIAAIAVSIISRRSLGYFDGMCIGGLLLGIFGTVFAIATLVVIATIPEEYFDEFWAEFEKSFEDAGGDLGDI